MSHVYVTASRELLRAVAKYVVSFFTNYYSSYEVLRKIKPVKRFK